MKRKFIVIAICFLYMIFSAFPSGASAASNVPSSYEKVAESDQLALYYNSSNPSIIVEDKRSGFIWNSSVTDKDYDMTDLPKLWVNNFNSLFNVSYTKLKDANDLVIPTTSAGEKSEITTENIKNGIKVHYKLSDLNIVVTLVFTLDGDTLTVGVPIKELKENDTYGIVQIEPLPFFGAANDQQTGYTFYPDGSGALSYFKTKHPAYIENYQGYVYGLDTIDFAAYDAIEKDGRKQAMLPVFGMKREDSGFVGIISKGEYDSTINFSPSGYQINLNRISAKFTYRRLYRATRPNTRLVDRIEQDMLPLDHEVKYVFLTGDQASYSGMANRYRKYLTDTKGIQKKIGENDSIPIGIDFLTGIKEDRLLFDKFISMTTFDEAKSILEKLKEKGVTDIQSSLFGWTKDGFMTYPQHLPPNRNLGGAAGLKRLSQYASKENIKLFLQDNFIDAYTQNRGFSAQSDVVRQKNKLVLTNTQQNRFLLNAVKSLNRFMTALLPKMKDYGIQGMTFEKFGSLLYYDYHNKYPADRQQTADTWNKFMDASKNELGYTAVIGGNAYVLTHTDRLMDIPIKDSGYFFTDESVPFYQMVVHGMIPYSSQPFNLFYDPAMEKLKAIEYGSMPYYQLTNKTSDYLKYTQYNQLFTSYYGDWLDRASEMYKEYNTRLKDTWSQNMIDHKKIEDNVYQVTYSNGEKLYVNYRDEPVTIDGNTIKGMDYILVDKEGKVK